MKNRVLSLGLLYLSAAMLLSGCSASTTPDNKAVTVEVSQDAMNSQTDIKQTVEISLTNSLVVMLPANASTGFSWTEAKISNPAVISQSNREEISGTSGLAGASGVTAWTFKALKAGQATIIMDYSRPWEGGEKGVKTYTLTVTVK
jgi:predicted secreted protein